MQSRLLPKFFHKRTRIAAFVAILCLAVGIAGIPAVHAAPDNNKIDISEIVSECASNVSRATSLAATVAAKHEERKIVLGLIALKEATGQQPGALLTAKSQRLLNEISESTTLAVEEVQACIARIIAATGVVIGEATETVEDLIKLIEAKLDRVEAKVLRVLDQLEKLIVRLKVIADEFDWTDDNVGSNKPTDTTVSVVKESWKDSRTVDITVESPSIDRNKNVRLLMPTGWSKDSTKTWPTIYMLHGGSDNYMSWYNNTNIEQLSSKRNVIVVLPDTSWRSAYSDWWNSGKGGNPAWETYLTKELPKLLSDKYNANNTRAIAGNSMGGLGAMKLAANHNTMFKAAASFSGDVDPLHQYENGKGVTLPGLGCAANPYRVWGNPNIESQRKIWEANNPWNQAHKLKGISLYLSSGSGADDEVENQVDRETKGLAKKLRSPELNIPVTTHFYKGKHVWTAWEAELNKAWPQLMKAIGA